MHPSSPSFRFAIAGFGELVADPSRVAMLLSLLDGLARPASELAHIAGVAPSTASAHLQRLTVGGLVCVEQQGRHRYYKLAGEHVADALEAIGLQSAPTLRCPRKNAEKDSLVQARTCYRHLAGRLGVAWLSALERERLIRSDGGALTLTTDGARAFLDLGFAFPVTTMGKTCLDWTERRYHLGGPLGAVLTQGMLSAKWVVRRGNPRGLRVTSVGRAALDRLGVDIDVIEAAC